MCLNPFLLLLFLKGFSWDNFNFQQFLPLLISNLVVVGVFLFFSVNNTKTIKHHEQHIAEMEARLKTSQENPWWELLLRKYNKFYPIL